MKLSQTPLAGVVTIETKLVSDARGSFERLFCAEAYSLLRPNLHFSQVNLSTTRKPGTIRGLHFQFPPLAEAKLIRCVRGAAFDVAVDVRAGSPTFLHWFGIELREDVPREVFIPEGFAHGFQTLTENTQLLYLHTTAWTSGLEGGLRYDDPSLAISWPLPAIEVSQRDLNHPLVESGFEGVSV